MSIEGVGIDIEEIRRFRKLPYKSNQSFYKKIFTPAEIKYCLSKADPYPHFTARFAAKEAVIKALGTASIYQAKEIEIVSDNTGQPVVRFQAPRLRRGFGGQASSKFQVLVSMSHTKDHAIAIVVVWA